MRVVVVTPPIDPVVTLEIAKQHLRIDGNDDDALITGMVAAVTNHLDGPEGWLGRALAVQTLELRLDHFTGPACRYDIRLPYAPIIEVASVKYFSSAGVEQTVAPNSYELLGDRIALAFGQSWPSARVQREAVRIRYRAGYEALPAAINAAILLMVGDLYANRESVITGPSAAAIAVPMSTTVEALLTPFRVFR